MAIYCDFSFEWSDHVYQANFACWEATDLELNFVTLDGSNTKFWILTF